MQTPSLKKKNTGVLQLWKKMVRWKADLCPSVSCGLTMGDVYWYWLSTGDRDEVDTDSEIRRDVFIKRKKKSSLCVHICVCRGGGTNLSHLNSKISQRERRTKTEEESLQTKSGLLTAHGNKHQGLQFNSSCGTAKVSYCSSTTVLCGGGIAKWVNSRAYEKSPRRLCPLNPLYYSPLSSSLVKLLLLQIVMGIDFFLLVRFKQWVSDVSVLLACCVQTEDEVDAHQFFAKDPTIFLASSFLMCRLKTFKKTYILFN